MDKKVPEVDLTDRVSQETIETQVKYIEANREIKQILDAIPEAVMVLNPQRQIVYVNRETLKTLGLDDMSPLHGLRPGETLNCIHATETASGCGTTRFCRFCGALNAILAAQRGEVADDECRIIRSDNGTAIDLKIKVSPYVERGAAFTVVSLSDISGNKRKEVLESIFFHDLMNTAGGLHGYCDLLINAKPRDEKHIKQVIYRLSERIINEINAQRQLVQAENGKLQIQPLEVNSVKLIKEILEAYAEHEVSIGKTLQIDSPCEEIDLVTDPALLSRILGNMVKNALEASKKGGTVQIGSRYAVDGRVEFWVHNETVIPEDVQMQIFQRSFSTKGLGRGLGTYSIKLLTERYLNGDIHFNSDEESGTTFIVTLPEKPF